MSRLVETFTGPGFARRAPWVAAIVALVAGLATMTSDPIGVFNDAANYDIDFDTLDENPAGQQFASDSGWLGFTDRYWLTALAPAGDGFTASFRKAPSGAYQAEVFRGAYQVVSRGELEAARSVGMHRWLMFRRIIAPQVLRYAIPGLGNTWQLVLKESALISVTGLVELLRQSHIAAGSTRRPFDFYLTAGVLYLLITWVSTYLFQRAETHSMRGMRRAS